MIIGGFNLEDDETGLVAAWLLALANVPVVLSLLSKAMSRFLPVPASIKVGLQQANQTQKRYLMPLHYGGNLLALGIGFIHFLSSSCRSTSLPEWGLFIMSALCITGIVVKFKLVSTQLKRVFLIHVHPVAPLLLIATLVGGHAVADEGRSGWNLISWIAHAIID
jgi:hypothetical protein